jgi:hypothetical protein
VLAGSLRFERGCAGLLWDEIMIIRDHATSGMRRSASWHLRPWWQ